MQELYRIINKYKKYNRYIRICTILYLIKSIYLSNIRQKCNQIYYFLRENNLQNNLLLY